MHLVMLIFFLLEFEILLMKFYERFLPSFRYLSSCCTFYSAETTVLVPEEGACHCRIKIILRFPLYDNNLRKILDNLYLNTSQLISFDAYIPHSFFFIHPVVLREC